LEVYASGGSS
jgi:hypothetical protein